MCKSIASCVLIIVNLLFLLVGAALVVVGALIQWGRPQLQSLISSVAQSAGAANNVDVDSIFKLIGQYVSVLQYSGLIIFIIGIVLFSISFMGMCGICCKSKFLLGTYVALVILILAVIFAFTIVFGVYKNKLTAEGRTWYTNFLMNNYIFNGSRTAGDNGLSALVDLVQISLACCGASNYTDFNQTNTFPTSCCVMTGPGSTTPNDANCNKRPFSNTTSYYLTGCFDKVSNIVTTYSQYSLYALIGLCVILAIFVALSIFLLRRYAKETAE